MVLEGEAFDRPLTHDLLVEMLTEFGGAVDRVRVETSATVRFTRRSTPSATTRASPSGSSSTRVPLTRWRSRCVSTVRWS